MAKKIEWKWEVIDEGTRRAKVFGGWIVHTHRRSDMSKTPVFDQALVFIADRDHEWLPSEPLVDPEVNRANLAKDYEVKTEK
jgi:hypothetical protein